MPTIKLGNQFRLKVSDMGGTPVFSQVGGEGTLSYKASSDKIDISSKDDGQVKAVAMGQSELMIDLGGVCNTPDTGLSNLVTAYNAGTPVNVQIVNGATTKLAGSFYVGNLSAEMSNNQAMRYSLSLTAAAALTTNTLFA